MKICPCCGERLEEGALECPFCGEKFSPVEAPSGDASENAVTSDGSSAEAARSEPVPQDLTEGSAFSAVSPVEPIGGGSSAEPARDTSPLCGCGAEAKPAPAEAAPSEAEKPKKRKRLGLWIGLAAAVVLAAVVLVFYFTGFYIKLLPASKLKLTLVEHRTVEKMIDKAFDEIDELKGKDIKAQADVTFTAESNGGLLSSANILSLLSGKLGAVVDVDASKDGIGLHLGAKLFGNNVLDGYARLEGDNIDFAVPQLRQTIYSIAPADLADGLGYEGLANAQDLLSLDRKETKKDALKILKIIDKLYSKSNLNIEKRVDVPLCENTLSLKCDVYTVKPSEEELANVMRELIDHLSGGSYIGKKIEGFYYTANRSGETSEDIWTQLRESVDETARQLANEGFTVQLVIHDSRIVSVRIFTDSSRTVFDCCTKDGVTEAYCFSSSDYAEYKARVTKTKKGDRNTLKGSASSLVTIPVNGFSFTPSESYELAFDLDLNNRSALGTYAGTVTVKHSGDDFISLTVEPDGKEMRHTVIVVDPTGTWAFSRLTVNAFVHEGSGVSLPKGLPTEKINSLSELVGLAAGIMDDLEGQLGGLFGGGFGGFGGFGF